MTHACKKQTPCRVQGSSEMQAIVPTVQTAENLGSSIGETAFSSLNEDRSRSKETPADLTARKLETGSKRDDAERKNTQGLEMKAKISRSTVKRSQFFQRLRKKKAMNTWQWKSGEVVLLVLVTVVSMSVNAVPAILYFTLEVSVHISTHRFI